MITFHFIDGETKTEIKFPPIRKEFRIPILRECLDEYFQPNESAKIVSDIIDKLPERVEAFPWKILQQTVYEYTMARS